MSTCSCLNGTVRWQSNQSHDSDWSKIPLSVIILNKQAHNNFLTVSIQLRLSSEYALITMIMVEVQAPRTWRPLLNPYSPTCCAYLTQAGDHLVGAGAIVKPKTGSGDADVVTENTTAAGSTSEAVNSPKKNHDAGSVAGSKTSVRQGASGLVASAHHPGGSKCSQALSYPKTPSYSVAPSSSVTQSVIMTKLAKLEQVREHIFICIAAGRLHVLEKLMLSA